MRPARESRASVPFQAGSSGRPQRAPLPHQSSSQDSSVKYGQDDVQSEYTLDSPGLAKEASASGSRPSITPLAGQPTVSFGALPHQQQQQQPGESSHSAADGADVKRKKSLVRPERARVDPDHRFFNYRTHAAAMQADGTGDIETSKTGYYPQAGLGLDAPEPQGGHHHHQPLHSQPGTSSRPAQAAAGGQVRRGVSILARDQPTDGAAILRRGTTLRKRKGRVGRTEELKGPDRPQKQPLGPWMIYVKILTCCCPAPLLNVFGLRSADRQSAWREKVGILGICALLMAFVGFLTFGFTQAVCGDQKLRFQSGTVASGSMIFHGWDYSMDRFEHPAASGIEENSNPLYEGFEVGGMDGTFLFQIVNEHCLDIITPSSDSGIPSDGNRMAWYFPCNFFNQYGTSDVNKTGYADGTLCHTQDDARNMFYSTRHSQVNGMERQGQVYYSWDQVKNESRNLGVYDSHVLDFNLLNWLDRSQVDYPDLFDDLARGNSSFKGQDITMQVLRTGERKNLDCLVDTIRVGGIDADTIGCVASDVVLYASLVVILGVVVTKFAMAVSFAWFFSWRIGRYKHETQEEVRARQQDVEDWSENIYRNAPARYRPNAAKKTILPTKSKFTQPFSSRGQVYSARSSLVPGKPIGAAMKNSPPGSPGRSSSGSSLPTTGMGNHSSSSLASLQSSCPFPLGAVVAQPEAGQEPFNFPLAHSICLVTAYSESVEGLRTTLDSLATTDYPNSHKLLLIIADGYVKGHGNDLSTPDIVLTMMTDFITPPEEVQGHSYVAIAHGHKRHNMAKVYAGFYDYDDKTVERPKQQRVPMILVAKSGNMKEQGEAKPGNRGKRDSQVLLMTFLQKVMFDERMTNFEYEFFNAIWRCTGICADQYQTCLMVDADTKVFPDSLTRMNACMIQDPEIMGLCGETKIANKTDSWVTMIQVFEYYLAHHQTKAFESIFGGVTCLPGCFSMYRIKAPKGDDGYWVPIIANPDIVEHYSENVVDTLHKKNLLLLGEDRYLSTLMLKTFPRRKMMFCPQATCKTVVPDTFRVLLSQRRRWINSTVHNLFELLLVRDLCGTFCFSMQFVVFMDLVGTLVLPAAIAFTLYILAISCIPGRTKPTISLILLAFILGLPGVLIVITSRRIVYVGWMLIYLCSLPIWNFIFPFYSYLHMDDFSWGATRKIEGDDGEAHGDKDGEFDQSISMKRWHEWERERRIVEASNKTANKRRSMESLGESSASHRRQPNSVPVDYATTYGKRTVQMPAPLAPSASTEWQQQASSSSGHHSSSNASDERQQVEAALASERSGRPREYTRADWQTGPEDGSAERRPMLTSSPELAPASPVSPQPSATSDSRRTSRYGGGVSLRDEGPAANAQPVKTPRARRESSRAAKRSSSATGLPPGAAPA